MNLPTYNQLPLFDEDYRKTIFDALEKDLAKNGVPMDPKPTIHANAVKRYGDEKPVIKNLFVIGSDEKQKQLDYDPSVWQYIASDCSPFETELHVVYAY